MKTTLTVRLLFVRWFPVLYLKIFFEKTRRKQRKDKQFVITRLKYN